MGVVSDLRLSQLVVATSVLHPATRPLALHGRQNASDKRLASDRNALTLWSPRSMFSVVDSGLYPVPMAGPKIQLASHLAALDELRTVDQAVSLLRLNLKSAVALLPDRTSQHVEPRLFPP
jgi:hypothetical protein